MASGMPGGGGGNGGGGSGGGSGGPGLGGKIGGCLGQLGCSVVFIALIAGIGASCDSDSDPDQGDACYDVGEQVTNSAGETFICR